MEHVLHIPRDEFYNRTGVDLPGLSNAVVSPRDIGKITKVEAMKRKTLESLLRNAPLEGNPDVRPYEHARIYIERMGPAGLFIGQTFLQEGKLINTLRIQEFFKGYDLPGISKLTPFIIHGTTKHDEEEDPEHVTAFYVPPIVESFDSSHVILDGIHRSYVAMGAGTTMTYIIVVKESKDLPFIPHEWCRAHVVKEKPPREERYFGLRTEFYRKLGHVGIDG